MDYYQAIARGFQESIELISMSVDELVEPMRIAQELCTTALLNENKILCCGNGSGHAIAQIFALQMLHRLEQERPALPALCLGGDTATLTAVASDSANDVFARQLRALGQSGDVLLAIASSDGDSSLIQTVRAAHDRDMAVILLSHGSGSDISSLLMPEDVELSFAQTRALRATELQLMVVNCLSELIEHSLFGSFEL